MYHLAVGPLMWLTILVFIGGIAYRAFQLFQLTKKKDRARCPSRGIREDSPEERKLRLVILLQNSVLGQHPVMAIVSLIFHVCLFAVPILCLGHNEMLYQFWGICFFSLPDWLTNILTIVVLVGGLFFFMRRMVIPRVRAISTTYDHLILLITIAPFMTGFFAFHQWGDYRTMITIHILTGQLMLISIPFTKLGHMVFFFFARLLFGSEFSFGRGGREWST
jgi:nitrate reductase gamma subunit